MHNFSPSTMRNASADSLHLPLKPVGKLPMQTIDKNVIFRLKPPECQQRRSNVTDKKIEISNVTRTLFSDDRIKPSKSELDEESQTKHVPKLNEDHLRMFSSILLKEIHEKLNSDSRITGGGLPSSTSRENTINKDSPTKVKSKNTSNQASVTPKVSFKTKNVSKRITKVFNPRVSDLMLKFNEGMKEKSGDSIEDKIKVNQRNSNKSIEKIIVKNEKEVPKSESIVHIRKSIIESRDCNKINSNTKKNISLESPVKIVKKNSPLPHKKLSKVKSDPKRLNSFKKKSDSDVYSKNESIHNTQISRLEIPEGAEIIELRTKPKNCARRQPSFKTSPTRHYSGIVHSTIQKFESVDGSIGSNRSSTQDEAKASASKPKIPEKRCTVLKTKNLVVRDGRPKIKVIKINTVEKKKDELKSANKSKENSGKIHHISANLNLVDIKNSLKNVSQAKTEIAAKKIVDNTIKTDIERLILKSHSNTDSSRSLTKITESDNKLNNLNIGDIKKSLKSFNQEKKSEIASEKVIPNSPDVTKEPFNKPYTVSRMIADRTKITMELPLIPVTGSKCENRNIVNAGNIKTDKTERKLIPYEKVSFHNKLSNEKLTLPVDDNVGLNAFNDNICDQIKESQITEDTLACEKSAEEKYYDDVTLRFKPNNSFLWRENSQERNKRQCLSISTGTFNIYDVPKKLNSFKDTAFLEELNVKEQLVELLKSEDKNRTYIVEAVNELTTNDANLVADNTLDDEYEPLDQFANIETKIVHSKANCPLPEVPKESTENIYQCLLDVQSSMGSVSHNYEYCHEQIEPTTDSEDEYEYCKLPAIPRKDLCDKDDTYDRRISVSKCSSVTSSLGYEKISSLYENTHSKVSSPTKVSNYDDDEENIYDTIKPFDTTSISNCYESIIDGSNYAQTTNTKMMSKEIANIGLQILSNRRLQYDAISTFSQSTISSDQKSNSIYSQRYAPDLDKNNSMLYEKSPSDFSDKSDEWEDISDQEKPEIDTTITIIREKSKGRHWSRQVRHQWNEVSKSSSLNTDVFVSSPSIVYIATSNVARHYSDNDNVVVRPSHLYENAPKIIKIDREKLFESADLTGLAVLKVLLLCENAFETQETTMLIDGSDGEHIYEPLSHANHDDYFEEDDDSFDESDPETTYAGVQDFKDENAVEIVHPQLPDPPPSSNTYTLTRFATAAGKKMKQLKQNLTKNTRKKSENKEDNSPEPKATPLFASKKQKKSILSTETTPNANIENIYQNIVLMPLKTDETTSVESKIDVNRLSQVLSNSDVLKNNGKTNDNQILATSKAKEEKDARRKSMSFKFKIPISLTNSQKLSPVLPNVQNSTFYLNVVPDPTEYSEIDINLSGIESKESFIETQIVIAQKKDEVGFGDSENVRKYSNPTIKRNSNLRPNEPPPPPPDYLKKGNTDKKHNSLSWYDECGLFKASEPYKPETNGKIRDRSSNSSWYADIGLYQSSNISTSSGTSSTISGSGTCSTTVFSSPSTPTPLIGMFNQEPLYQFYDAAKLESVCRDLGDDYDSDNYEDISIYDDLELPKLPPAMSLISPSKGPSRTLWCEIPEVINSSYYKSLTPKEKKLQEAKFEIVTSEASYLNSLSVLESQYINNVAFQDGRILSKENKQILFGNIIPIKQSSVRFMAELEACWQTSIRLDGLCKIIMNHANNHFHIYINYCENQKHLVKTLKKLKTDTKFNDIINFLQSQPECQSLSLDSFVMLPMQRITRLPLLVDAVLKHLETDSKEYELCLDTLKALNNVVYECNEAARNFDRIEELAIIASKIVFPSHIQKININVLNEQNKKVPQRWLVRSGEVNQLVWRAEEQPKLTFGKKTSKVQLHLFLFTDIFIVTKKKSGEDLYTVVDYCNRSLIETTLSDMMAQSPVKDSSRKFVVLLTMLENHESKTVEMLLSFADETDRQRWIDAFPPTTFNSDDRIYEEWDCPQVISLYHYQSKQPDELSLQPGDVINVDKKTANGWYHGQRTRDDESGWFPGNHSKEIASAHVRARNLRQRYRLLELSGSYLAKERRTIF